MQGLLKLSSILSTIATKVGKISAWLLIALVAVIMIDVTLRHWFVIGSTKLQEMEWHLHGGLFLLCLGWTYSANAHVRIELLSEKWRPTTRAVIELVGCLVFLLPYVLVIIWYGFDYVSYSLEYNEASSSPTGLANRWIIKSAIPIGFLLLGLGAAAKLLEAYVFLFGSQHLKQQTSYATNCNGPIHTAKKHQNVEA